MFKRKTYKYLTIKYQKKITCSYCRFERYYCTFNVCKKFIKKFITLFVCKLETEIIISDKLDLQKLFSETKKVLFSSEQSELC